MARVSFSSLLSKQLKSNYERGTHFSFRITFTRSLSAMRKGKQLFTFWGSVLPRNNLHVFSWFTSILSLKNFISIILLCFQNCYTFPLPIVTNETLGIWKICFRFLKIHNRNSWKYAYFFNSVEECKKIERAIYV